jgi:hypothetical protein
MSFLTDETMPVNVENALRRADAAPAANLLPTADPATEAAVAANGERSAADPAPAPETAAIGEPTLPSPARAGEVSDAPEAAGRPCRRRLPVNQEASPKGFFMVSQCSDTP